ncbi:helix-turn-helix transcriptional regulator [Prauserella oleivorans]|uniref:Helix-turn-helix transcriptional regulator n=1 Tax=Prauserella oleivorans TaxID=1478153 RepID=A0ABW5WEL9_9PSEU
MLIDGDAYQRALGDELRKLRKRRGWTRRDLNERLQSEISLQTLATYELGTRQCSVVRLVELCLAMDELPHQLLARVHRRVFGDEPGQVRVNLALVAADDSPDLGPLRRWAAGMLEQTSAREVQLDHAALERMAELCGVDTQELVARLRGLSARGTRGRDPVGPATG